MAKKYLDYDGLLYFWQKIKSKFSLKSEAIKSITRSGTTFTATRADDTTFTFTQQDNTVSKTTTKPKMNGTAAVGSENKYAAGDHVHPSDTTKVDKVTGKGLSTNDFTDELLGKLQNIQNCAQVNPTYTGFTGKPTADQTPVFGSTFTIQQIHQSTTGQVSATDRAVKIPNTTATTSLAGLMSAADKAKLDGIAEGAEVNWPAFSAVKIGTTNVSSGSVAGTLELSAGDNVTLTPDAANKKVTIAATDTTYEEVTAGGSAGLMSGSDKTKLDGIAAGAEVNPTYTAFTGKPTANQTPGFGSTFTIQQIKQNATGQVSATDRTVKIPNATATASAAGLMSAADKKKLDASLGNGIGTCSTSEGTLEKTVALTGYDAITGGIVVIKFENKVPITSTLNINSKGAKGILYRGANIGNGVINAGDTATFVYDGTNYVLLAVDHNYVTSVAMPLRLLEQDEQGNPIAVGPRFEYTTRDGQFHYEDIPTAAPMQHGLMSGADKIKLDKLIFDSNNLIDSSILPSYVDDVIEAYPIASASELTSGWLTATSDGTTALTPETGKIYVLMTDTDDYAANTQFRWGGSAYIKLNDGGVSAITNTEIDTILAA